jgi:SepF-like predicted cell division protein (DUF552 family)
MGFTDTLKRSLGFEEEHEPANLSQDNHESALDNLSKMINNLAKPDDNTNSMQQPPKQQNMTNPRQAPRQNPNPNPRPAQEYDEYEVITPEQSFYEIVLIRPKTIDDINYVVDQVIEENNPVILDLSFLERESAANFKLAGDKIKQMRSIYGVQALLLARTDDKDLIIVSPKKVRVINKG